MKNYLQVIFSNNSYELIELDAERTFDEFNNFADRNHRVVAGYKFEKRPAVSELERNVELNRQCKADKGFGTMYMGNMTIAM